MAENGGEVKVKITALVDSFKAEMAKTRTYILATLVPSIINGIKQVAGWLKSLAMTAIHSYAESERVGRMFEQALRLQGVTSAKAAEQLKAFAGQLQDMSRYSDEAILSVMTMFTRFGMTGKTLRDATQAAVDFSVQAGGLENAASLIGRAFMGNTERLKLHGLEIMDVGTKGERFAQVLDQIRSKMGGAARADAETFLGQLDQLANQMDEIAKAAGKELMPDVKELVAWVKANRDWIIEMIRSLIAEVKDLVGNVKLLAEAMTPLAAKAEKVMDRITAHVQSKLREAGRAVGTWFGKKAGEAMIPREYGAGGKAIGGILGGMAGGMMGDVAASPYGGGRPREGVFGAKPKPAGAKGPPAGPPVSEEGAGVEWDEQSKAFIEAWQKAYEQYKDMSKAVTSAVLELFSGLQATLSASFQTMFQGLADGTMDFKKMMTDMGLALRNLMFKIISDILAKQLTAWVMETAAHTAKSVKQVTNNAAVGASEAAKAHAGIPFIGIAMGIAAAAAIIAIIMAFAGGLDTGGIVQKPTFAALGEKGRKEAVINLESQAGKRALREAGGGGGGNITVNISGQFLEADAGTWDRLVRQHVIPAIDAHGRKTTRTFGTVL